jgi:hypothetical protein
MPPMNANKYISRKLYVIFLNELLAAKVNWFDYEIRVIILINANGVGKVICRDPLAVK